jgi:hypothetical protein
MQAPVTSVTGRGKKAVSQRQLFLFSVLPSFECAISHRRGASFGAGAVGAAVLTLGVLSEVLR